MLFDNLDLVLCFEGRWAMDWSAERWLGPDLERMTTKMIHWCVASDFYNLGCFLECIWPLRVFPRMHLFCVWILHLARQLAVDNSAAAENQSTSD